MRLGRYELLAPFAQGGMAELWTARVVGAHGFARQVVVKRIRPDLDNREAFLSLLIAEAKISSGLQHPNIVSTLDLGEEAGEAFIVMEHVPGRDLLQLLAHSARLETPIPEALVLEVIHGVCEALVHAHEATDGSGAPLDIVHFDVSPANVLLGKDGAVKLTDFGVARARYEEAHHDMAPPDRLRGKFAYMSPEQVEGRVVDQRTDLFSLGIVMFEMLSLERLFRGATVPETLDNVRRADVEGRLEKLGLAADTASILRAALARRPEDRYPTARTFARALRVAMERRDRPRHGELWSLVDRTCRTSEERTGPISPEMYRPTWGSMAAQSRSLDPSTAGHVVVFHTEKGDELAVKSYADLVALLASRSVVPDDLVSVDGSDWTRVRDIPWLRLELDDIDLPEATGADRWGNVEPWTVIGLVVTLCMQRATGRLRLQRAGGAKDILLRRGLVVHTSTNQKSELLGPFLVRQGLISQKDIDSAFAHARANDLPLGTAAANLGLIGHGDMLKAVRKQLAAKLAEAFTWQAGRFEWFEGDRPAPHIVPLEVDPLRILAELLRQCFSCAGREAYLRGLGPGVLVASRPPPELLERLALGPREQAMIGRLSVAPGTLRDLWGRCTDEPGSTDAMLLVLCLLHQLGHLELTPDPRERRDPL